MERHPEDEGSGTVTLLLKRWQAGDPEASQKLFDRVYRELHQIAKAHMRRERSGHTLQPTAVVHEAYLRLIRSEPVDWKDRAHFYAVVAQQLRRVLIDYARRVHSEKRGGEAQKMPLWESDAPVEIGERLLALDEALERLQTLDPRAARVVELRFFAGFSEKQAAEALDISLATLKRDWTFAKTWLTRQLG